MIKTPCVMQVRQRRVNSLLPVTPLDIKTAFGRDTGYTTGGPFQLAGGQNSDSRSLDLYSKAISLYERVDKMEEQVCGKVPLRNG